MKWNDSWRPSFFWILIGSGSIGSGTAESLGGGIAGGNTILKLSSVAEEWESIGPVDFSLSIIAFFAKKLKLGLGLGLRFSPGKTVKPFHSLSKPSSKASIAGGGICRLDVLEFGLVIFRVKNGQVIDIYIYVVGKDKRKWEARSWPRGESCYLHVCRFCFLTWDLTCGYSQYHVTRVRRCEDPEIKWGAKDKIKIWLFNFRMFDGDR